VHGSSGTIAPSCRLLAVFICSEYPIAMFSGRKRSAGERESAGTWQWLAKTVQGGASALTRVFFRKPATDTCDAAECGSPKAKRRRTSLMEATPALSPLGCGFTPGRRPQAEISLPAPFRSEDLPQGTSAEEPASDAASVGIIQVRTREDFWRAQLDAIYSRRNPLKRKNIPALMEKYKGREAMLYRKVCQQYCLCPTKFYAEAKAWEGLESDGQDSRVDGQRFGWRGLIGLVPGVARFFGGSGSDTQGIVEGGRRTTLLLGASHENLDSLINGYGGLADLLAQNASSSKSASSSSSSSASAAGAAVGSLPSIPAATGSETGCADSTPGHRVDRPFTFSFSGETDRLPSISTAPTSQTGCADNTPGHRVDRPFNFSFSAGESSQSVFSKCSLDKAKEPVKWQPIWPHQLQSAEMEDNDGHSPEDRTQGVTFRKRRADPEVLAARRIVKVKRNFSPEPSHADSRCAATPQFGQDSLQRADNLKDVHLKRKAASNAMYTVQPGKAARHEFASSVATPVRANQYN